MCPIKPDIIPLNHECISTININVLCPGVTQTIPTTAP